MGLASVRPAPAPARGLLQSEAVLRYCVTTACAGSAGIHAALVQPHLAEAGLPFGLAFAATAALLALAALSVRQPRNDRWAPATAAGLLSLVAVSYLLSRTTGLPLLLGRPERVDPLGALTTAAELAGALAGAALITRKDQA